MDHIGQIESLIAILSASFEAQIQTIHILGKHRMRSDIVHCMRQLVQALINFIETTEQEFVAEIEYEAEQVLGHSATLVTAIAEARKELPQMAILDELFKISKSGHSGFTISLAQEEQTATAEIAARFTHIKKCARAFLGRIENL